jgi:hypothetical protein
MGEERPAQFVAVISTPDQRRIRELSRWNLEIFGGRPDGAGGFEVHAWITLVQVGLLAEAGYKVSIGGTGEPRHTPEFIGFEQWRKQLFPDLELEQKEP